MTWYWIAWLILGFGVPEGVALGTGRPQNTLSDTVWRVFQVHSGDARPWHWTFAHLLLACFLLWLTGHFVFRIWR